MLKLQNTRILFKIAVCTSLLELWKAKLNQNLTKSKNNKSNLKKGPEHRLNCPPKSQILKLKSNLKTKTVVLLSKPKISEKVS
jgi:hypothetical protein